MQCARDGLRTWVGRREGEEGLRHRQLFSRQRSKDDFPADINKPFFDSEAEPRRFRVRWRDVTYFLVHVVSYYWKECGRVLFQPADKMLRSRACFSLLCRWRNFLHLMIVHSLFFNRLGPRCVCPLHTRGGICKRLNNGAHCTSVGASWALQQGDWIHSFIETQYSNGLTRLFFPGSALRTCSFLVCACAQTCYICEDQGRESKAATGACMTCNKHGCRQAFHVTWWDALTWHQPRGNKDTACSFMSAVSLGVAEENWVLSVKSNLNLCPPGKPGTSLRPHKLCFPSCFDKITIHTKLQHFVYFFYSHTRNKWHTSNATVC